MDSTNENYTFRAGEDVLRVPFVVNVKGLSPETINSLVDSMSGKLGAKFFWEKDLFMEVLSDKIERAKDPYKFLYGPFIGVFIKDNSDVRLASYDATEGGMTVYSVDQYIALADSLDGVLDPQASIRSKTHRPKM